MYGKTYKNPECITRIRELGKSIRNYVVGIIITTLTAIITLVTIIIPNENGLFLFLMIVGFFLGIFLTFIFSIKYLIKLYNLKISSQSQFIVQIFNLEIIKITVSLIISLFIPSVYASGTLEAEFDSYLKNLPIIIITIIIAINYRKWIDELHNLEGNQETIKKLRKMANLYIIGALTTLIPLVGNIVGKVIIIVTLLSFGNNLELFSFEGKYDERETHNLEGENNIRRYQSNADTFKYPKNTQSKMEELRDYKYSQTNCPKCNMILEKPDFMYCPRCGYQIKKENH